MKSMIVPNCARMNILYLLTTHQVPSVNAAMYRYLCDRASPRVSVSVLNDGANLLIAHRCGAPRGKKMKRFHSHRESRKRTACVLATPGNYVAVAADAENYIRV